MGKERDTCIRERTGVETMCHMGVEIADVSYGVMRFPQSLSYSFQKTVGTRTLGTYRSPRDYCRFQKPLTVPTRAPLADAGIGNLDEVGEGRLCTGDFSVMRMGRRTFGGMRDGGIGSFDVGDTGPGLASAGACRDCVAITFTSLAGGLNLDGAWGILERAVVGEGRDVLPATGSLDGVAVSFAPAVTGVLRLFGFAVNRKIDFDRGVDPDFVGATGWMPAADARDVRLLGAGRRETRDSLGDAKETRDSDADGMDASEIDSRDAL